LIAALAAPETKYRIEVVCPTLIHIKASPPPLDHDGGVP
jgi:hypothetical protein